MAVLKPCLMRGLYIPDANFTSPIGDTWQTDGNLTDSDITFHQAQTYDYLPSTGRFMRVSVDGLSYSSNALLSAFSPHGVAADASATNRFFWVAIIAKTWGVDAGNTNPLVRCRVRDYDEDGSLGNSSPYHLLSEELGVGSYFFYNKDWALYAAHVTHTPASDAKHYRVSLHFSDENTGGTVNYVDIAWCGVGLPMDWTTSYDQLSAFYDANPSRSQSTLSKIISHRNTRNPHSFVQNPENAQSVNVNFPILTKDDKELIEQCEQWHNGMPTDDINDSGAHVSNRGNKQPVLWVMDRPEFKRAFYAHMSPFMPMVSNANWYPETGARHAGALSFTEWL